MENCLVPIPLYTQFISIVTFEIVKTQLALNVLQFVWTKIFKNENTVDTLEVSFWVLFLLTELQEIKLRGSAIFSV